MLLDIILGVYLSNYNIYSDKLDKFNNINKSFYPVKSR